LVKNVLQIGSSKVGSCLESKLFERRRLDEKVGSFLYFGIVGIGFVFLLFRAKVL
tara:strand:+ start:179 stop:343 length:165 start_codon:yes stop_codon:yes gene_type:complete